MKKNRIKTASLLTAAVIAFNITPVLNVSADEAVSISTVKDFQDFTERCVYDEYSKNKTFVLQNDLDLNGVDVKSAEVFCGVFDGGGHNITNLRMSFDGSDKGLFGTVTNDAQIKNLNVTGDIKVTAAKDTESLLRERATTILGKVNIQLDNDNIDTGDSAAGGIAGYNSGKIINCSFSGKIDGQNQVGGIAGYNAMRGVIDACVNNSVVNGKEETGGLAGYNEGRVKMSENTGQICPEPNENNADIGGISGNNKGAVFGCTNSGTVGGDSFGDNVGGISGRQSGEISECVNNGTVKGRRSVGGICGRFEPYTDIDLSYESAKDAIEKQADIFKNDVDSARSKLINYGLKLINGEGTLSELMSLLGIEGAGTGKSKLDKLTDAAINMMDSVTDAVDSANNSNIADSIKNSLDSVGSLSDEAKQSVRDTNTSLNNSLDELNDFLNEFDGKGQEITDTLNSLNDAVDKGQGDVDEIKDKLFDRIDDMEGDIDDLTDKLDETHSNLQNMMRQLRNAGGEASEFFGDLNDVISDIEKDLNKLKDSLEDIKKEVDNIKNNSGSIIPTLKPLLPTPNTETASPQSDDNTGYSVDENNSLDSEYNVQPSIVGKIKNILSTTAYAAGEEEKTAISDLKSTDISLPRLIGDENADTALIKYSINNGNVEATELAGGVSGSTGFESVIRSGDSITLPDGTKVNADSILKAVTDSCISCGDIKARTNYAGGISGKCDIGNIKNSLSTGGIEVTDGNYAGGIAGFDSGDITNCIAINDISAQTYLGGIAGSGKFVTNSYALPRLDGKRDKSGAIAGFISGDVSGTYFIDEGLSGIGGANLEGKAQAVKPRDIASSDGTFPKDMTALTDTDFYMASDDLYMPQIRALAYNNAAQTGAMLQSKSAEMARFHFKVVFMDKGKELKAMTVEYGTVLSDSDIPKLTADGQDVPAWDNDVHSPIIRHTTFTAEYNRAKTTISSGEEPPLLLLESVFDEGTNVSLAEEYVENEFDGYKKGNAYSFTINKNSYDVIKVHIRDEKKDAAKIAVMENGKWTLLECETDGSYAVFEVGAPCKFVILYKKTSPLIVVFWCMGVLAAFGAGFAAFRKFRRKYGTKEEKNI